MNTLEENDTMKEMERKPYSSESIRVRCPSCRKLYLVQSNDIKEAKPRFECVQCHGRFWLSIPDMDLSEELTGIPLQKKEPIPAKPEAREVAPVHVRPCPKCFKPMRNGQAECTHCGVILAKVKEFNFIESKVTHSEALGLAWKKVLAAYGKDSLHHEFIRLAEKEGNLPFAAAQYGQMLKLLPNEETTLKRVREVQALASTLVPPTAKTAVKGPPSRWWHLPLVISAAIMIVGMILPVFRNMVGVGAAIFFIALAMQLQSRPRR